MKIAVLVKQVPESRSARLDETTGTVVRDGGESVINPLDLYAVNAALAWKRALPDAGLCALSMGPASAEKVLREALARGIDDAVLICDRAYAGSDTFATAAILATALQYLGGFDLVLTGERATDGDTGQVGPELAARLGFTCVNFADAVVPGAPWCRIIRRTEYAVEEVAVALPAVIGVSKAVGEPGLPTLAGFKASCRRAIRTLSQAELVLPEDRIGLKGSPTRVVKTFRPTLTRVGRKITAADPASLAAAAAELAAFTGGLR